MTASFNAARLWEICLQKAGAENQLRRNAYPYLLRNDSEHTLQYDNMRDGYEFKGSVAPGEYFVVQPQGEYHLTNRALHARGNAVFADAMLAHAAAAETHAAIAGEDTIAHARDEIARQNHIGHDAITLIGWCRSISTLTAYRLPTALNGATLNQPNWGKHGVQQMVDTNTQMLVAVNEAPGDCYLNPKGDFADWVTIAAPHRSGNALIAEMPELTAEQCRSARQWTAKFAVPSVKAIRAQR